MGISTYTIELTSFILTIRCSPAIVDKLWNARHLHHHLITVRFKINDSIVPTVRLPDSRIRLLGFIQLGKVDMYFAVNISIMNPLIKSLSLSINLSVLLAGTPALAEFECITRVVHRSHLLNSR